MPSFKISIHSRNRHEQLQKKRDFSKGAGDKHDWIPLNAKGGWLRKGLSITMHIIHRQPCIFIYIYRYPSIFVDILGYLPASMDIHEMFMQKTWMHIDSSWIIHWHPWINYVQIMFMYCLFMNSWINYIYIYIYELFWAALRAASILSKTTTHPTQSESMANR